MTIYTIHVYGESASVAYVDLEDAELATAIKVADAINSSDQGNYEAQVWIWPGRLAEDEIPSHYQDGTKQPLNPTYYWWRNNDQDGFFRSYRNEQNQ